MIGGQIIPMGPPSRPLGRDAEPGDLQGPQRRGEWPAGQGPHCRRCGLMCSMEGHPHGCPRTPRDHHYLGMALRPCYCGATLVTTPAIFGPCCENTPPVHVPGGCPWCGSDLCRIGDPEDFPDVDYAHYGNEHPVRYPEFKGKRGGWTHARCYDEFLIGRGVDPAGSYLTGRREKRRAILGVIDAT
jgi:hypothetical protein